MKTYKRLLKTALFVNAGFSAVTGTLLLLLPDRIGGWLGTVPAGLLLALGAGLLVFAAVVAWQARSPAPLISLAISLMDLSWVIASIGLVFFTRVLTPPGTSAVLAVAALVGTLALLQLAGIRRMMRNPVPVQGLWRHCIRVRVDVPARVMWPKVADIESIARYSPGLAGSWLENPLVNEIGAVRTCMDLSHRRWSEKCEHFDPVTRSLRVRFLCDRDGFPFPARVMHGGWNVSEDGEGSIVEVWWSLTPTISPGWLIVALMGAKMNRDVAGIIARMAEDARGRPVPQLPPRLSWRVC